jgi:hypothetical protein
MRERIASERVGFLRLAFRILLLLIVGTWVLDRCFSLIDLLGRPL